MTLEEQYDKMWAIYQSIRTRDKRHYNYLRIEPEVSADYFYAKAIKSLLIDIINDPKERTQHPE